VYLIAYILALISALLVCYLVGMLMHPNKKAGVKVIGFLGLLFIDPIIYSLIYIRFNFIQLWRKENCPSFS
jgi:hypothetical protein